MKYQDCPNCVTYLLICLLFIGVKYRVSSDSVCRPRRLAAKRSELRTSGVLDSPGAESFLQKVRNSIVQDYNHNRFPLKTLWLFYFFLVYFDGAGIKKKATFRNVIRTIGI